MSTARQEGDGHELAVLETELRGVTAVDGRRRLGEARPRGDLDDSGLSGALGTVAVRTLAGNDEAGARELEARIAGYERAQRGVLARLGCLLRVYVYEPVPVRRDPVARGVGGLLEVGHEVPADVYPVRSEPVLAHRWLHLRGRMVLLVAAPADDGRPEQDHHDQAGVPADGNLPAPTTAAAGGGRPCYFPTCRSPGHAWDTLYKLLAGKPAPCQQLPDRGQAETSRQAGPHRK